MKPKCKSGKRCVDKESPIYSDKRYCIKCCSSFHPLKLLRINEDMTQQEFGNYIGYSQSALAKIEAGGFRPNFTLMWLLVESFEEDLNEFVKDIVEWEKRLNDI